MFGLSLQWERCPDGVVLAPLTIEAQAARRDREIRKRAEMLWYEDVRPEDIPSEYITAARVITNRREVTAGARLFRPLSDAEYEGFIALSAHRYWVESASDNAIPEKYLKKAERKLRNANWDDPRFVFRSERRSPILHDLVNLENPIAIHFINARDDRARELFLSRFGLPTRSQGIYPSRMHELQNFIRDLVAKVGGTHQMGAIDAVNEALSGEAMRNVAKSRGQYSVVPVLDFPAGGTSPRLALQPETLLSFMVLEAALVATHGAQLTSCEHCQKYFLTGHMTGRRSSAKYCSDRCRVAAMRKRNAAKEG